MVCRFCHFTIEYKLLERWWDRKWEKRKIIGYCFIVLWANFCWILLLVYFLQFQQEQRVINAPLIETPLNFAHGYSLEVLSVCSGHVDQCLVEQSLDGTRCMQKWSSLATRGCGINPWVFVNMFCVGLFHLVAFERPCAGHPCGAQSCLLFNCLFVVDLCYVCSMFDV